MRLKILAQPLSTGSIPLFWLGPGVGFVQNRSEIWGEVGYMIEENMRNIFARWTLLPENFNAPPYSSTLATPLFKTSLRTMAW